MPQLKLGLALSLKRSMFALSLPLERSNRVLCCIDATIIGNLWS